MLLDLPDINGYNYKRRIAGFTLIVVQGRP